MAARLSRRRRSGNASMATLAGLRSNAIAVRPAPAYRWADIRRPRDTPIWKLEAALKCRSCRSPRYAPPVSHDQAHTTARAYTLRLGTS
jgi:hypothetical protein